jgi:transcriptional regulator of arginine metabolism
MRIPDTKTARHHKIREIVLNNRINSQQQLLDELSKNDLKVTQATLSRDLDEIGVVKRNDSGQIFYQLADQDLQFDKSNIAASLIIGIDHSANIVVVRTPPGAAQFFASSIDKSHIDEIIGTIAGDDTVLIVTKDPNGSKAVSDKLWGIARSNR